MGIYSELAAAVVGTQIAGSVVCGQQYRGLGPWLGGIGRHVTKVCCRLPK